MKFLRLLCSILESLLFLYADRQRQAERRSQEEARADIYRERDRERKRKQYLGVVKVSILYGIIRVKNFSVKIMVLWDDNVRVMLVVYPQSRSQPSFLSVVTMSSLT